MISTVNGVCIVATDGVYGMGIMLTKDMFYSASLRMALNQPDTFGSQQAFPVLIASPSGDDIKSYSGTVLQADCQINDTDYWDLIFLGHFWGDPNQQLQQNPTLIPWLKLQHQRGTQIIALGSGVFWLAQAGLLDHREATTYWHYQQQFEQQFPLVLWQPQAAITQSDNLCCVAGATSANDILLHHIAKLCGSKVAQGISRDILFDSRRSYEVPTLAQEIDRQHDDQQILQIQSWLDANYAQIIDFSRLAIKFNMSKRNFARRFEQATNKKPLQYLQQLRISVAKEHLIYSNHSIKRIALDVGYQDSSYFSTLFKRVSLMSPAVFRQQYKKR